MLRETVSLVDMVYGPPIVSTGSLPASPLHGGRVPAHPVCSGAFLSCYMETHSAWSLGCGSSTRRGVSSGDPRAAVSDADDRRGDLCMYTLRRARPTAARRLVARRQVVNLPRFEAPSAQL